MCGKILIFALLGCSLVLASPIQENIEEPAAVTAKTIAEPIKRGQPGYLDKMMKDMEAKAKNLNQGKDNVVHGLYDDEVAEVIQAAKQAKVHGKVGQFKDTVRNEGSVAVERQPNDGFFGRVGQKVGGHVGGSVDKLVHSVGQVGGHIGNTIHNVAKDFSKDVHDTLTTLNYVAHFIG